MAEVVGVVASVMTTCHALFEGVDQALKLYRAPKEMQALAEQVTIFRKVVHTLETSRHGSMEGPLYDALQHAQRIITELHQLVTVKLVRRGSDSARARRRTWFRYRRRISHLRDELRGAHEVLVSAISVSLCLSAERLESDVASLHRKAIGNSPRLLDITSHKELASFPARIAAKSTIGAKLCPLSNDTKLPRRNKSKERTEQRLGLFERLTTFRPESYTIRVASPTFYGYSNREVSVTDFVRIISCSLFYARNSRQWERLTATVTISIDSQYWDINTAKLPIHKQPQSLPKSLTAPMRLFLNKYESVPQDAHLSIFLSGGVHFKTWGISRPTFELSSKLTFDTRSYLRAITNVVRHWKCPWYSDRELIQQPYRNCQPNRAFFAWLDARWVLQERFGSEKDQIDKSFYMMQAFHCMEGTPGIASFLGIVVDDDGIITSFLRERPFQGDVRRMIDRAYEDGFTISAQRREKWCRQIVQAIAAAHSQGFVVGHLNQNPENVFALDRNDDLQLYWGIQKYFCYRKLLPEDLPPEYRPIASTDGIFPASPETDLYHLGLLLKHIITDKPYINRLDLYRLATGGSSASESRIETQTDRRDVPLWSDGTPRYLKDVIMICKAEAPHERLPAWKLLGMFPSVGESAQPPPKLGAKDLSDGDEFWTQIFNCDICALRTTEHHFYCDRCHMGDYDICLSCFSKGLHCLDNDHKLVEHRLGDDEERYYTAVKETGKRDVVTLSEPS